MRRFFGLAFVAAFAGLSAGALAAVPAPAETDSGLVLHGTYGDDATRSLHVADPVGDVKPGETFTITGACVADIGTADSVRVVLTAADTLGADTGFRSIIATDRFYRDNVLHVRAPDMAEAANRTFQVKLFIIDQDTPDICDAGAIRISAQSGKSLG